MELNKIAFGGGCHWCTEAVFQSLKGVIKVEQGYVASLNENSDFSEAIIVHYNKENITLKVLIEIHLNTHKSTSAHSMRNKYRSAIYTFNNFQEKEVSMILNFFQKEFQNKLITKILPFKEFKASREAIHNYYINNPKKPFCETFIKPKIELLQDKFLEYLATEKSI